MRKIIPIALLGLTATAIAQPVKVTVIPYLTYIHYAGSGVKKSGYIGTLYTNYSFNLGKEFFTLNYAYTHLNYKGDKGSWNQNDYTITYGTYQFYPFYAIVGFHYIKAPQQDFSRTGSIPFIYVGYGEQYVRNTGIFAAYSSYKQNVGAFQLQLRKGYYWWLDYYRGFYYSGNITWINVKGTDTLGLSKRNYYSVGFGISYIHSYRYNIKASVWAGERVLMVDKLGYVVYNLPEKYRFGGEISGAYFLNKNLWVKGILGYAHYKELTTQDNVDTYTITMSVGYSF